MGRLLLLFLFGLSYFSGFSQTDCYTPISNLFFQKEYGIISSTSNTISKLYYATNLTSANCLSSSQVKQVTMLFYTDQDKLEFCKAAYKNTVDKDNFYNVYDAFAYFSTVFRLHDYVLAQKNQTTINTITYTSDYPVYSYPDFTSYFGVTGCNSPLDESSFYNSYNTYKTSKMNENAKATAIKEFINMNCLSTSQIMKLTSILYMETSKLELLKAVYLKTYDRGNFGYADQLLTTSTYKLDFNNFIKNNTTTTTIITNNCTVTTTDMTDIKNTINNSSFDNTKITIGKQAISAKKCFTVNQIKEILGLYSFESSKLEMAKYVYDFCIDKSNYYQVNDVLSFTSSKDDLTNYIKGRQ